MIDFFVLALVYIFRNGRFIYCVIALTELEGLDKPASDAFKSQSTRCDTSRMSQVTLDTFLSLSWRGGAHLGFRRMAVVEDVEATEEDLEAIRLFVEDVEGVVAAQTGTRQQKDQPRNAKTTDRNWQNVSSKCV